MCKAMERAEVLLEALPYIRKFSGKTIVIKYGGAAMDKADLREQFAQDIVLLHYVGLKPVIVHGGGPQISTLLDQLGIESEFIQGHRVTDDKAMDVVEMVLSGSVNKSIVALINKQGGRAVGLSGRDGWLARAGIHMLEVKTATGSESIPLGRVGHVTPDSMDDSIIHTLEEAGYIPVIAPVAVDKKDIKALNVNADTFAGALASRLQAEKLILLTDTPGVLSEGKTLTGLKPVDVQKLLDTGVITGGMIPKVQCCLDAIDSGVKRTHIIDGRVPHALLLEILTDKGVGTLISSEGA